MDTAEESGVSDGVTRNGLLVPASEKGAETWSAADKFTVVLKTARCQLLRRVIGITMHSAGQRG